MFTLHQNGRIRQKTLYERLDLSRTGFFNPRKKDPTFPKPIKDGTTRQAAVYYDLAEVDAWLKSKIAARDAA
ncbi:MAG: transcriptional regulator [Pseudomonas sp.]|nr:MAG: transcriptional regulator [Pseudomonas sp.]